MNSPASPDTFISVDIEAAGPNPSQYSLLTIGAVVVGRPRSTFYVELRPVNPNAVPESLMASRLSMARLAEHGQDPAAALRQFENWLKAEAPPPQRPVFVGFNAAFDWMFLNDYFHRFLGRNPFGHSPIDAKSFYMGLKGCPWEAASMREVGQLYLGDRQFTHHALRDAMDQAEIFEKLLQEAGAPSPHLTQPAA
jgi:DNA polymerase III epsilon subunit-like protein